MSQFSVSELQIARMKCIYNSQQATFMEEISAIRRGRSLSTNNPLTKLNPFIDTNGILRVGGRLENSGLSYEERHPAIIHGKTH